jgi:hypothetical protein
VEHGWNVSCCSGDRYRDTGHLTHRRPPWPPWTGCRWSQEWELARWRRGTAPPKNTTLAYRVTVLILMWRYSREIESKRRPTIKHDQEEESQPTVLRHLQIPAGSLLPQQRTPPTMLAAFQPGLSLRMTEGPGASDLSQSIGPEAELPSPSAAAAFGAVPRGLLGRGRPQAGWGAAR